MSDRSFSPTPAATTSTKRKSTGKAPAAKRTKTQPDPYANTKVIIQGVLASPESFALPGSEAEIRNLVLSLAQYARSLEGSIAVAGSSGKPAPPPKTAQEVAAEAERLANMVNSGVSKQMSWKPSCKTGSAKFAFDGVCADPRVFGAMLGLDGPPTFKAKKFTATEFQELVGDIDKSIRYDTLRPTSDINVRWNPQTGEFKVSGSYGK